MRSRSLAISAGIHGAAAALLALVGGAVHAVRGGDGAALRREIPVEIVAPAPPAPLAAPPLALVAAAPAAAPALAPASPPHRAAPRPPPSPAPPAPSPAPSPAAPAAPAAPEADDTARRAEAPAPPSGDAAGGAPAPGGGDSGASTATGGTGTGPGGGTGTGTGGGTGTGTGGANDLSRRPIPLSFATSRVLPYTAAALERRITGDVRLVLHVDATGAVAATTFRQRLGHGLDEIAAEAARKIRFQPARDPLGRPTAGDVAWRFHFEPPPPAPR
ncbi:MAG TPA: TonB family protein [Kofleriaceae bacterium]|nr:TonB family protein [Kofleriaceae bacterium]